MTNVPRFDLESWWKAHQATQAQLEKERVGAVCPHCGADLLQALKESAYEWSYGLPSAVAIWCEGCGTEVEFSLEWDIHLWKATPMIRESAEPI
jgi:hypothetical protein